MRVNKKTLRDLIARDDMPSLLKILRSLQREMAIKEELEEEYVREAEVLSSACGELQRQTTRLVEACRELKDHLAAAGKSREFRVISDRFGGVEPQIKPRTAGRSASDVPPAVRAALEKLSD